MIIAKRGNRWTKKVTEWQPRINKINPVKPKMRFEDDIQKVE